MEANQNTEISDAERRRNRRRQKILENAEGRIQRITGSEESGLKLRSPLAAEGRGTSSLEDNENMPRKRANKERIQSKSNSDSRGSVLQAEPNFSSKIDVKQDSNIQESSSTTNNENGTSQRLPITLEDGSTLHPKIPAWVGRIFVCFLGVLLSVFNGKYFMVTFFSWEVAFLGINGLPTAPPPGIFLALVALIGLREPHLHRLRFVTQLLNTLITDLSLFVISALLPRVILKIEEAEIQLIKIKVDYAEKEDFQY